MSSLYGRQILWFMLNAWLHVRVINFRIIIIIISETVYMADFILKQ